MGSFCSPVLADPARCSPTVGSGGPAVNPWHRRCPLLLAPQGPALASGNAHKLELGVCSGEKMLSEVKVVPQPALCLCPGCPPRPAAARAIEEWVSAWSQGFCPSASGCFVWDTQHHQGLAGCSVPSPGAAEQQKELGTCLWHVLQTEVRLSPAAPRCSAGGIQADARACGWVPHTVPCKAANSGWSVPKWHFQSHQPWHGARRGVGMQSCAQPPCPRDAWCHPPVPPDPSWEQAGAISSGGARFRPRKL